MFKCVSLCLFLEKDLVNCWTDKSKFSWKFVIGLVVVLGYFFWRSHHPTRDIAKEKNTRLPKKWRDRINFAFNLASPCNNKNSYYMNLVFRLLFNSRIRWAKTVFRHLYLNIYLLFKPIYVLHKLKFLLSNKCFTILILSRCSLA